MFIDVLSCTSFDYFIYKFLYKSAWWSLWGPKHVAKK
jgi:hypothetical protein